MKHLAILAPSRLAALHDGALAAWYKCDPKRVTPDRSLKSIVLAQHCANFRLWNLEDQARRRDVPDSHIVETKRSIDFWNQARNDLAERIDEFVLRQFGHVDAAGGELHSETAGMMVDRLSILSLKIKHMGIHAARRRRSRLGAECAAKQAVLKQQRAELCRCLDRLLGEFKAGRRYFKTYRQFKQYNDPRLNPHLKTGGRPGHIRRKTNRG